MRIKTFQGATMSEAMKAVKAEMGADAVILEVKEVKKGNRLFRPPFPSVVEVIAANDLTHIEESLLLPPPPRMANSPQTQVAVGKQALPKIEAVSLTEESAIFPQLPTGAVRSPSAEEGLFMGYILCWKRCDLVRVFL
jgi:flagellar biosynthesis GTPase FlhF